MENNYKADDWFNVGIDVGSLLSETTLGQPNFMPASDLNGVIGFNTRRHIFPMMPGPVIFPMGLPEVEEQPEKPIVGLLESSKVQITPVLKTVEEPEPVAAKVVETLI